MSAADAIANRIDRSMSRLDAVTGNMAMRLQQQIRADDAEAEQEQRDRLRRNAERCRQLQERYDTAFAHFGKRSPQPKADAKDRSYRCDLFLTAAALLPRSDDLTKLKRDELEGLSNKAFSNFERDLLERLAAEGDRPSPENTPADGSLIKRERTDSMGTRIIDWFGRESFIKGLSRPGRHVASFHAWKGDKIAPKEVWDGAQWRKQF
jgi:hypothetical protein